MTRGAAGESFARVLSGPCPLPTMEEARARWGAYARTMVGVRVIFRLASFSLEEDSPMQLSARNVLKGMVKSIVHGAVNSEVTVQLPGGQGVGRTARSGGGQGGLCRDQGVQRDDCVGMTPATSLRLPGLGNRPLGSVPATGICQASR